MTNSSTTVLHLIIAAFSHHTSHQTGWCCSCSLQNHSFSLETVAGQGSQLIFSLMPRFYSHYPPFTFCFLARSLKLVSVSVAVGGAKSPSVSSARCPVPPSRCWKAISFSLPPTGQTAKLLADIETCSGAPYSTEQQTIACVGPILYMARFGLYRPICQL